MLQKRKGFTLVELLIVIIIIGILAGAMMLASGSMTATARASTEESNLRSAQVAALTQLSDVESRGGLVGDMTTLWTHLRDTGSKERAAFNANMNNAGKAEACVFGTASVTGEALPGAPDGVTVDRTYFFVGRPIATAEIALIMVNRNPEVYYMGTAADNGVTVTNGRGITSDDLTGFVDGNPLFVRVK